MSKSADAFRTISEVAEWLDTPTHVLRFWESKFPQVKPVKRAGGRRYYRPSDMELLSGIKQLLHEDGLTIRGVQKILREQGVRHVCAMSPREIEGYERPDRQPVIPAPTNAKAAPPTAPAPVAPSATAPEPLAPPATTPPSDAPSAATPAPAAPAASAPARVSPETDPANVVNLRPVPPAQVAPARPSQPPAEPEDTNIFVETEAQTPSLFDNLEDAAPPTVRASPAPLPPASPPLLNATAETVSALRSADPAVLKANAALLTESVARLKKIRARLAQSLAQKHS